MPKNPPKRKKMSIRRKSDGRKIGIVIKKSDKPTKKVKIKVKVRKKPKKKRSTNRRNTA